MLKLWFSFCFFAFILTWLFASRVQSFNVCMCICICVHAFFSISSSLTVECTVCTECVWMCATFGHRAILRDFISSLQTKYTLFPFFSFSFYCAGDQLCSFFHFTFARSHAVSSPYQTSTFARIRVCVFVVVFLSYRRKRSIFRVYKMVSICFIIMEKKRAVEESPKIHSTVRDEEMWKKERQGEKGEFEVMREVQATTDIFVRALVHKTHS